MASRVHVLALVVFVLSCAPGCAPPPRSHGGPIPTSIEGVQATSRFLATRDDGAIVVADAATGAILAVSPSDGRDVSDLVFDASNERALAVMFGDADAGELVAIPMSLDAPAFADPEPLAPIDGDVRILPTAAGRVTFQIAYASERWCWTGGGDVEAWLPPPRSAWITDAGPGAVRIETLTSGDPAEPPRLVRQAAIASAEGLAPEPPQPLSIDRGNDPSARLVPVPAIGDALLVDVEEGVVVVHPVEGAAIGGPLIVPGAPAATRIEAAIALEGGRVVVAATNGPPRLVAVAFGESGEVLAGAALDLPAPLAVAGRFFSRDLTSAGEGRVLIATAAGVVAVTFTSTGPLTLTSDPAFAGASLRGPLSLLPRALDESVGADAL